MLVFLEFEKEPRNESHIDKNGSKNNESDIQKSEIENFSNDVAFIENKVEEDLLNCSMMQGLLNRWTVHWAF